MPRNRSLLALPVALAAFVAATAPAHAATLTVNSLIDASDQTPGNGICATGANVCTLRAAVQEAAGLAGADTIALPAGNYQLGAGLGTLPITTSVTIDGAGARTTTIRAAAGTRPISISATTTIRGVTVTGGTLASASIETGGGIRVTAGDVTVERSAITGNQLASSQGAYGGGIGVETPTASLTLIDSTVAGNSATGSYNGDSHAAASGGGIYTSGPGIIKRSTIAANTVVGGIATYGTGGGAYIDGLATIEQSTFAGNGVSTIGDSSGFRQGGNLYLGENASIGGTILSGGTASYGADCYQSGVTVTETAKNLESQASPCLGAGSLRGVNPKLGSLADNGGPTDTMRPAADSPAIDAAANCGSRSTDQRGNALFGGTGCDLGAVEIAASRTVTLQTSKTSAAAGDDLTLIAKVASAGFDDAVGESLAVELPAGVTATSATSTLGSCTIAGNVTCALGTLGRSTAATVIVTVRASGSDFVATARRSGSVPDQQTGDDAASVSIAGIATSAGGGNTAGGGSTQSDAIAPALTGLAVIKKPKPSLKKGATLSFTLSEPAAVAIKVERVLPGRRAGKGNACKAKGTGKRCERTVPVATITRQLAAGAQRVTLTRKQLKASNLRFTLSATDAAGNRSTAASVKAAVRR